MDLKMSLNCNILILWRRFVLIAYWVNNSLLYWDETSTLGIFGNFGINFGANTDFTMYDIQNKHYHKKITNSLN